MIASWVFRAFEGGAAAVLIFTSCVLTFRQLSIERSARAYNDQTPVIVTYQGVIFGIGVLLALLAVLLS